jgi:hypothetical protein
VFAGAERMVGVSAALTIADASCTIFGKLAHLTPAPVIDNMHVSKDFCLPYPLCSNRDHYIRDLVMTLF